MFTGVRQFSVSERRYLLAWTIYGTLCCVGIAMVSTLIFFADFPPDLQHRTLVLAAGCATLLALPLLAYLTVQSIQLRHAYAALQSIANTDSLTEVLNRGAFTEAVEARLGDRAAISGALLIIDADHFKAINDRYGHDRGDAALQLIAARIRAVLRQGDLVGRMGGEEFGVFLPGADLAAAMTIAERIRAGIGDTGFSVGAETGNLTVSIGGIAFADRLQFKDLFRHADQRLYAAKLSGRNRVSLGEFQPEPAAELDRFMQAV